MKTKRAEEQQHNAVLRSQKAKALSDRKQALLDHLSQLADANNKALGTVPPLSPSLSLFALNYCLPST